MIRANPETRLVITIKPDWVTEWRRQVKELTLARIGRYAVDSTFGEQVRAYLPPPLPPTPALMLEDMHLSLDHANQFLGRLDGLHATLPDTSLLLSFYSRREAVLSSQIEGTQSSLSDLLLFENDLAATNNDVEEVSNYVAALQHGLNRIRSGFPLSNRLFNEMHAILLRSGRGAEKSPGEFRTSQNWIGGTRPGNAIYVPPPVAAMVEGMSDLEKFLHRDTQRLPLLVDAGLAHAQFESLHPFLDGNGRLGRLLVTLLLCERGVLSQPSLYLSLYLKRNRREYYEWLQRTRTDGDWEGWLKFFLEGIAQTAREACELAQQVQQLFDRDRERLRSLPRSGSVIDLHHHLQRNPFVSVPIASKAVGLTGTTVNLALQRLVENGIVREMTGKKRDRIYVYSEYMRLLEQGGEPL